MMRDYEAVIEELEQQLFEAFADAEAEVTAKDYEEKLPHLQRICEDLMQVAHVKQLVKDLVDPHG